MRARPPRVRRHAVAVAVGAAVLTLSTFASAFCRTTTSAVPPDYDPSVSGCWTQGVPLAWHASRAPYGVESAASVQVSLADATRLADVAFSTWNHASCSGHPPSLQTYDDGPITAVPEASDCSSSTSCDPAGRDVIVFDDVTWPHQDKANTLALTTVTYGVDDGAIFEAYTEVNSTPGHPLTVEEPPPAGSPAYDLQAILTHEAGHFFGLAHATSTSSVMYAFYKPGKVELTTDDVDGVCTLYPPSSSRGCACSTAPGAGASAAGLGLLVVTGLVTRGRRRRRP